jgi:uncharacterized membrane protein YphA (DoxX/SURF4 family)
MLVFALVFTGAALLASGLGKFTSADSLRPFAERVGVPKNMITPLTAGVAIAEVAIGVLLIIGLGVRWTSLAAVVLACGFAAVHAVARLRGVTVACRCFGALDTELRPAISTIRALVLLAVAVALAVAANVHPGLRSGLIEHPAQAIGGVLALSTYLVVFQLLNEVATLVSRDKRVHRELLSAAARLTARSG